MTNGIAYPVYKVAEWIHENDRGCLSAFIVNRDFSEIEHSHDFYEFLIAFSGDIVHKINGQSFTSSGGDLWIIRPGERHLPKRISDKLEACIFSVSSNIVEPIFKSLGITSYILQKGNGLRCRPTELQMHMLHSTLMELQVITEPTFEIQYRLALSMIFQYYATSLMQNRTYGAAWFDHILSEMRKPENLALGVPAIEKLANMSRSQLCRIFKRYVNQTPQQFVLESRLSYAHNLICNTDMSFELIANAVGYSSLSHFSIIFKEHYHYTPSELRKRTLKLI